MSASVALQDALLTALKSDAALSALIGARVYDQPPPTAQFPYVEFGADYFRPNKADDLVYRVETLQIDVWTDDGGKKWPCKQIVDAVTEALDGVTLSMASPYACASCNVVLARVTDDPDGMKCHGIVQVEAGVEKRAV